MLIKRRKRRTPQVDTTSMADVSFMLLTFFLVTSSMDADKGLVVQLPPIDDADKMEEMVVEKENLMNIVITSDNSLLINGNRVQDSLLCRELELFIFGQGKNHIIQIEADPASNYATYFNLQDKIMAAYANVRDSVALKQFGLKYSQCGDSQRELVRESIPQRVSEPNVSEKGGGDVFQTTP